MVEVATYATATLGGYLTAIDTLGGGGGGAALDTGLGVRLRFVHFVLRGTHLTLSFEAL